MGNDGLLTCVDTVPAGEGEVEGAGRGSCGQARSPGGQGQRRLGEVSPSGRSH